MLSDHMFGDRPAVNQMLLDDPLEHRRVAGAVPHAVGVDDGDRSTFADAEAIGLRPQNPSLFRELELFQPRLQVVPGGETTLLVAALRGGLVGAQEDVAAGGVVTPAFKGSGDITSMSQADGYIEIPAGIETVEKDTLVEVTLF